MRTTHELTVDTTILRATGVIALLGVGTIHFLQIVETFQSTPLLGLAYVALIAASIVLAGWLVIADCWRAWAGAGLLGVAIIVGYALTRLVGTTFDNQDVGNWSCMLGLASLFVDAALVAASGTAIAFERAHLKASDASIARPSELALEAGPSAA